MLSYLIVTAGLILIFILVILVFYYQMNYLFALKQYNLEQLLIERTEELITEREKREAYLGTIMPKSSADEMMSKGKAAKIKYNFVTVLFSDIQGFTKIAEEMNPEVLIDELDKFFFTFDSVVEKYGIEKIKTIGDAYMCAGGIPEKNRTNPVEVVMAAIEMRAYMDRLKKSSELEGMKYWDIRIGIHTGTVIAGVVGQRKLTYDIWGDTVNTASRMESSGEAGKINISGTTYEFVKDFFSCEYRGKMPVKYKGELEMYFVNGILPELCDEDGRPNKTFNLRLQVLKLEDVEEIVLQMFETDQASGLSFNNANMVKSICSQTDLLSRAEKIEDEDFVTLKLAAILLLTGYIFDYHNPSAESIKTAEDLLPKHGFEKSKVEIVKNLISNSFSNRIDSVQDRILHDARYDYLGRVDYPDLTEKLRKEISEKGRNYSDKEWTELQTSLLKEHSFLTKTAKMLRNIQMEVQVRTFKTE